MLKHCLPIVAVLALAACDSDQGVRITRSAEIETDSNNSTALKVISALQCPSDQGSLTRVGSASVDGRTCTYAGPRGAEVKLHLVDMNGRSSEDVLKAFQLELVPANSGRSATVVTNNTTREEATEVTAPGVKVRSSGDEDASVHLPGLKIDSKGDNATIKMPGMSIEAEGERARIKIGGLVINADDSNSNVSTTDGSLSVNANENGALVHTRSRQAVRATMIHAMAKPAPSDWRVVGYEARGPSSGPLVVATFRTRDRDEQAILDSVRELVILNVGD